MSAKQRVGGVVVPHTPKWHRQILAAFIVALARLLMFTWRMEWVDRSGLFNEKSGGPLIFCLWHNRLALSMSIYHRYVKKRRPAQGLAAVISASRDGGLLAEILADFGVMAVRGSSSRRGPQALLEATTWTERGCHVAITPDGPRGPCYQAREGAVALAQLTGLPLVPVSAVIRGKIRIKSWDRFQIPLPFARCRVFIGEPVSVPRELDDARREQFRRRLEESLRALTPD